MNATNEKEARCRASWATWWRCGDSRAAAASTECTGRVARLPFLEHDHMCQFLLNQLRASRQLARQAAEVESAASLADEKRLAAADQQQARRIAPKSEHRQGTFRQLSDACSTFCDRTGHAGQQQCEHFAIAPRPQRERGLRSRR